MKVEIAEGRITSEALEKWCERIGIPLRIRNIFNTEVTKDSIKHFVDGIGDTNPLWTDEEYARNTSYGKIPAPPNWLYSVFPTWILQGLPGVHGFHAGSEWTFYKPVRVGDTIKPKCTFTGFEVRPSEFAGKSVIEYQHSEFYNQKNELVAETDVWIVRTERGSARKRGKYSKYTLPHPWKEEELKKIEEKILSEKPRGENHLFWEDVNVGDELPEIVKGPFGLTDMIAFCIGANPVGIKAFKSALEFYKKHPAWAIRDPNTYALEPVFAVHYNKFVANSAGLPYPYDVGVQRHCWLIQLLTNYIGNEGWLKKNYAEYRRFFYFSDVVWIKGKVVSKYISEGREPCIDIETHAFNQRGEDIMPGFSTVVLPSKEYDYWPVKARLKGKIGIN